MSKPDKIWAIIPARGGSKGIPRKNIKLLGGHPLIAYSIHVALQSGIFQHVLVSTDDEEIAEVARQYGGEVPFLRPASLAGDGALTGHAIANVLDEATQLFGEKPEATVVLPPTSPFRTPELVRGTIDLLQTYMSACTVTWMDLTPGSWCSESNGSIEWISTYPGSLRALKPTGHVGASRLIPTKIESLAVTAREQFGYALSEWMRENGLRDDVWRGGWVMDENDPCLLDIDTPEDWAIGETILDNGWFSFEALGEEAVLT